MKIVNRNQKHPKTNSLIMGFGHVQPDFAPKKRGPNFQPKKKKK